MNLPLCVRIDAADERGRAALAADGWREIEMLNIFERGGLPLARPRMPDNVACPILDRRSPEFAGQAAALGTQSRNGRLWRDQAVDAALAAETYAAWIANAANDPATTRIAGFWCGQLAGFLLLGSHAGHARVLFFAVHPSWRGNGIGRAMLRTAMSIAGGVLRAGTQSDNAAASRLYLTEGFAIVEQQRTFHKMATQ